MQKDEMSGIDRDGDNNMENGVPDASTAEIVTIPITVDDELSDIPADMRETVAKEIAAFRDRSTRRDLERMKREEEIESLERARSLNGPRPSRLASPPVTAPSGPAGGANGVPVGPRERPLNAPSGPKAFGQQIPRDYQKGVSFLNGTGINGAAASWIDREDENSEASDEELERRRKAKKDAELEKQYLDQERRWLNRERSRTAAVEREKNRDKEEDGKVDKEKDAMATRLKEWNDDVELNRRAEEYYLDRSMWIRNRATFRSREAALDDADRAAENKELARDHQQRERAGVMADDFLSRQADEMESQVPVREPQRFKLSLGAAAQKAQTATQPRRTAFEVEGLLEDEEEDDGREKRTLIPIQLESAAEATGLSEEERAQAARQLAQDIPTDKEGLWRWQVKWDFVDDAVIAEQLKPFVEKKIMEYLGVQEQMLVDVVESHLTKRGGPQGLVEQLEGVSLFCLARWRHSLTVVTTGAG
jgi:PWI domain